MVQYDEIVHPELFFLGTPSSVIPSASLRSGRLLFQGRKQDSFLFFSIYCKLVSLRPYSNILISGTLHEPLCHWTRFLGTARSLLQSATTEHSGGGTKAPPKPHLAVHRSFLCGGTQEPPELPLLWNRRSWCWWRSQFCYHFFRQYRYQLGGYSPRLYWHYVDSELLSPSSLSIYCLDSDLKKVSVWCYEWIVFSARLRLPLPPHPLRLWIRIHLLRIRIRLKKIAVGL